MFGGSSFVRFLELGVACGYHSGLPAEEGASPVLGAIGERGDSLGGSNRKEFEQREWQSG